MESRKLPIVHRRGKQWGSSDMGISSARKQGKSPYDRLLAGVDDRHLSVLNSSFSPVGNRAKLDFIDTYKNIAMLSEKNKINKLIDPPSVAYLRKVSKYNLNPEPFGIVRRQGPDTTIDIHNYSMGDVYASAFSEGLNNNYDIKILNLSNNRLTENGCVKILQKIQRKTIKSILLAENKIGNKSGYELIDIIEDRTCKLRILDLENTGISDKTISDLCRSIKHSISLRHLNLAKNNLAYLSALSLREMLKTNSHLKRLDLHWNSIRNQGACEVFEGLSNNNYLQELDLSWNSLGRDSSLDVAKSLGKSLESNKTLLHLDISYNYLSKTECEIISESLKENHTVLGLHALGNDCKIDSKGFMIPSDFTGKTHQGHFFSRILKKSKDKKKTLQNNCWICEKWIEVHFRWTPRVSGEASMAPIYLNLECDDYEPELMIKQKDGSFLLTRVVPPEKIKFFFSNKSKTLRSEEFKTYGLVNPLRLSYGRKVSMLNSCHFQGETCKIKEPFRSKPRIPGAIYVPGEEDYEHIPWDFNKSVFVDYKLDSADLLNDCFEYDWKSSKLANFIKSAELQNQTKKILRENYEGLNWVYKNISAYSGNELFCVTQNVLIEFLNNCGLIDNLFQVSDLGVNWNSANATKEKGELYNAGNGLTRYEFIEILVRIVSDRLVRSKVCSNVVEALEKAFRENLLGMIEKSNSDIFRKNEYMTEEIDCFIRAHKTVFDALYKKYSGRKVSPGQKPFVSLEEFRMLCSDSGVVRDNITARDIDVCFSQAMMTQVDIIFKKRHLEMNYVEFLEAIFRTANLISLEENPEATLKDKILEFIPKFLKLCPQSVVDNFVKPTEETYFKMMYRLKNPD